MEHKHILYDIEDDAIDRGDTSNLSEALSYFNIDTSTDDKKDTDTQLHGDALYHNLYYKDKKYAIRQLKMKNKKWHKTTNYEYTRKIK
tara:strand:+ start:182 stop:445 length:264 start_codon:yes stop_codon:yes gene_type:complete